ncbi:TPA: hypothetical protein RVR73_003723 [Aeromonas hydrophila]|nr:hypothetical protein [Aeromonas hydrophila]
MKRLNRNPGKFEALEVFSAFSREHDYKLQSTEDTDKFIKKFSESLKASLTNPILLHGKRMEALFGQLAAGLGNCKMVKSEDTGEVISDDSEILLPDYRIILKDGRQIFVEVKNSNGKNPNSSYLFQKKYVEKLMRYSELNSVPLYFAIYYRCLRIWTLLPVSSLIELKNKYSTNPVHSLAKSEISLLGDLMIGTKLPLTFELVVDKSKEAHVDDHDQASFTCGDIKIYCCEEEIEDLLEKNIAFFLMRYGSLDCGQPEAVMDDNGKLHSVRYIFNSESAEDEEKYGFTIIGNLSSMITEAFNEHTVYEQQVTSITTKADPAVFSIAIPSDYKGQVLKLWRFTMQANPEFKDVTE